ncbi:MAG: hypothetical protein Q9M25_10300 [Mariprofundaceae bacterium]|nr:hypothetical protein [Mariprofundaceae bacterium]
MREMKQPEIRNKRSTIIVIAILGIAFLALAAGAAHAAKRSIQLNSPATFPVDI